MKKLLNLLSRFKYLLALVAFGVWMLFFDANRVSNQIKLRENLRNIEIQKKYYQNEIRNNQQLLDKFRFDSAFMERYAREQYLLKKDNEVIYLIVPEE
ncbi:hypothetical protein MASR2M12_00650 [Bacteroidales bacterium]